MAEPLVLTVPAGDIRRGAVISPCGRYRYCLTRHWGPGPKALFIMLNPSTADADVDDPTIRRLIGFTRSWGRDGFTVVNLYGIRRTKPPRWWDTDDIGPENDAWIERCLTEHDVVVCAWGVKGEPARERAVLGLVERAGRVPRALGLTADGNPRHPLYIPYGAQATPISELLPDSDRAAEQLRKGSG